MLPVTAKVPFTDADPVTTIPQSKCTFGDATSGIRNAVELLPGLVNVAFLLIVNELPPPLTPAEKFVVLDLKCTCASFAVSDVSIRICLESLPDNVKLLLINFVDSAESVESVITVTVPCLANVYRSPFVNGIFAISYFVYLIAPAVPVFMFALSNVTLF